MGESDEKDPKPSFWERNSAKILYLYLAVAAGVTINWAMWRGFVGEAGAYRDWSFYPWEAQGILMIVLVRPLPYVLVGSVGASVLKRLRLPAAIGLCLLTALLSRICQAWYWSHFWEVRAWPFPSGFRLVFSVGFLPELAFALGGGTLGFILARRAERYSAARNGGERGRE